MEQEIKMNNMNNFKMRKKLNRLKTKYKNNKHKIKELVELIIIIIRKLIILQLKNNHHLSRKQKSDFIIIIKFLICS